MTTQVQTIPSGFGSRLRDAREAIGRNQTQLAEIAGIKRMAQGQYENEVRAPTVKYLSAVAAEGIDLQYVLFGCKTGPSREEQRRLERQVFDLVEQYARQQPDGQLGAEGRFAMFEFLRAYMSRATADNSTQPMNPAELIAGFSGAVAF